MKTETSPNNNTEKPKIQKMYEYLDYVLENEGNMEEREFNNKYNYAFRMITKILEKDPNFLKMSDEEQVNRIIELQYKYCKNHIKNTFKNYNKILNIMINA